MVAMETALIAANDLEERYRTACAVALEAGTLAKKLFLGREAGAFELKGMQDYLTEADGEVERLIARRIAEKFPKDTFLGEEEGGQISARTWVVDPIDGTANFARGIPHFSISIAYVEDGKTQAGAICNPMASELFSAKLGGGARLNDRPMAVSKIDDMRRATFELGWSTRLPLADYVAMVGRITATGAGFIRAGSGALGLAYVAAGRVDGYCELHINSWDSLAGLLMVREAGGWTNDFLANDGLRKGNPIIACTPGLKKAFVTATGVATAEI
jgi:myo-inositol-1(or 4)-monophosphatase